MIAGRAAGGKAYRKEKPFNIFRRIQTATKTKIIILVIVAALAAGGVTVAFMMKDDKPAKKEPAKKEVAQNINPLTGLELTGKEMARPFIVSTDNDSAIARPQAGLSQADIMYEVPIEGGGSRYEPIYYSQVPENCGAIRSCRPYIINIAREYKAVLVHDGNSPQAKELFVTIRRLSASKDPYVFHEEPEHNNPSGNRFATGKSIVKAEKKEGYYRKKKNLRTFPWLGENDKVEGKDAKEITINYADGAYNTFKYDPDTKLYTKYVRDETMVDENNGKAITCANILVQKVPFQTYDEQRLDIDMTAGGKAVMFTQGKAVKGTWSRDDLDSPTIFKDKEGKEFKMTPGNTWIQLIDTTVKFDY